MRLLPETRNSRFLAVTLLLISVLAVYFFGVHWWFVAPQLDYMGQMEDLREQELKLRHTTEQRAEIEKRQSEVNAFEQNNQSFLSAKDASGAFSDLTKRLKQAITDHVRDENRCQILSNQPFRGGEDETYQRVSIQVRMRCDLEPFSSILYDLENGNPYLFVDQLMIYKQSGGYVPPGSKAVASFLDIRFNLSGYLRQHGKPQP